MRQWLVIVIFLFSQPLYSSSFDSIGFSIRYNIDKSQYDEIVEIIDGQKGNLRAFKEEVNLVHDRFYSSGDPKMKSQILLWQSQASQGQEIALAKAESALEIARFSNLPELAFLALNQMGAEFYHRGEYQKSLSYYNKSREYIEHIDPKYQVNHNHAIALLKVRIGDNEGAISLFNTNLDYFENDALIKEDVTLYLYTVLAISDMYLRLEKYEDAIKLIDLGLAKSHEFNHQNSINAFMLEKGIFFSLSNLYEDSNSILYEVISNASTDLVMHSDALKYIVYNHVELGNIQVAISYVDKIESIYHEHPKASMQALEISYSVLYEYAKNNDIDDLANEYSHKILSINPLTEKERSGVTSGIINSINNMEISSSSIRTTLMLVGSLCLITLLWCIYLLYKLNKFRIGDIQKERVIHKDLGILEDTLLQRLNEFEEKKGYLNEGLSLKSLANELGSNSSYTSRIINKRKDRTFTKYIQELRINYIVDRMRNDTEFMNYTLNAMAKEGGFSSYRSFQRAFEDKFEMSPSIYLQRIKSI